VVFWGILSFAKDSHGQMRTAYPKRFSIDGVVELIYKDYSIETKSRGRTTESNFTTFEQRYTLGLKGYIYHPKLIVFTTRLTFRDQKMIETTSSLKPDAQSLIYELQTVFLPYRPVSLQTYTTVSDYTFKGLHGNPYDTRITNYAAILGINLRNWPKIKLEYYHLNITPTGSQDNKEETTNNSYHLNIRGTYSKLRTQYTFTMDYMDTQAPSDKRQDFSSSLYTRTDFKLLSLTNYFRYLDLEDLDLFGYYATIDFKTSGRFYHTYNYLYEQSKEKLIDRTINEDRQEVRADFNYRFSFNLSTALSATYGLLENDDDEGDYYAVSFWLNYSRPIKQHYFVSRYALRLRDNDLRGKYTEHWGNIEFTSKNYRWGRLYMSYNITRIDGTFKIIDTSMPEDEFAIEETPEEGDYNATTHYLVLALRGRMLRKASWSVEAEYINSHSTTKRPKRSFDSVDESESPILVTKRDRDYYLFLGELFYPIGIRGSNINLRSGYSNGEIDSKSTSKLFYEVKLNVPISRRLLLASWVRQAFYKIEGNPDRDTTEVQVIANYRRGNLFLSAEYWLLITEENNHTRNDRRIILKAKRQF
jgi:hypothetical protein